MGSRKFWWAGVAVAATVALTGAGVASAEAAHPAKSPGQSVPRTDRDIPNLTLVEDQIEAFYGDTVVGGDHFASPDSNYARQVGGIEGHLGHYLAGAARRAHPRPAVVFDVDDTTLITYTYELEHGFAFDPVSNDQFVQAERMTEVFGMPGLVNRAAQEGITVFFVTGRPESERAATAGNLAKVGYRVPADTDHLFLKNTANPPPYLSCGATCTTIQYKSQTRAHIENLGFTILADVGDQFSDLAGGHSGRTFKLPNPMYFLP
ncbi:MAG TPA: HAD family acid phosphatase [Mycobacteriales bacterium]|nr:HAD family acid phosphatase [Mycobacteriales bacterium]